MNAIVPSPVAEEVGLDISLSREPGPGDVFTIYQLDSIDPERIEAVNFVAQYDAHVMPHTLFILRLVDISGRVTFTQASPDFILPGSSDGPATWELTWARFATGTDQIPPNIPEPDVFTGPFRGWWTGPLPDLILQPRSTVTLQWFTTLEGGSSLNASIPSITVTSTRNPNTSGETTETVPAGPFMLVPGPAS